MLLVFYIVAFCAMPFIISFCSACFWYHRAYQNWKEDGNERLFLTFHFRAKDRLNQRYLLNGQHEVAKFIVDACILLLLAFVFLGG